MRPSFGHAVGHRRLEPLEVAHIALFGDDAAPGLFDEVHRLVEILGGGEWVCHAVDLVAQVERDDVRAFLGESHRVRTALSPCRSGDESDLALQLTGHRTNATQRTSCVTSKRQTRSRRVYGGA